MSGISNKTSEVSVFEVGRCRHVSCEDAKSKVESDGVIDGGRGANR